MILCITKKVQNVMINRKSEQDQASPNEMQLRLAEYYTRAFAATVTGMRLSEAEKNMVISAVNIEYQELISAGRRDCLEMVS